MKTKQRKDRLLAIIGCLSRIFTAILIVPEVAYADLKPFAYTYLTKTISAGELELEHYLDMGLQGWDDPATEAAEKNWGEVDWKHNLEFEYGITDAWDFGLYNQLSQKPYGSLNYDGIKLRTRYNFAEGREWLIQPGLYFEVGYFGDAVKFEEMVIVSLEIDIFVTSLNLKAEQELEYGGGETEMAYEAIISYGAGIRLGKKTAISLEYYGKAKFEEGELDYFVNYLGPTLHIVADRFYWNISAQPQLGTLDDKAAVRIRSLFAVQF
ncbi:MAG: hypothetical protein QNJ97_10650 [Myxococcota bacterium]|nr:hypothetical protein [Myxococcota bacterium]